jgi:hypothetical protein
MRTGIRGTRLAYVVHPASLWKDFGPIHLEVAVPEGVPFRASVPCKEARVQERGFPELIPAGGPRKWRRPFAIYEATLADKTGELLLAVDADAWNRMSDDDGETKVSQAQRKVGR